MNIEVVNGKLKAVNKRAEQFSLISLIAILIIAIFYFNYYNTQVFASVSVDGNSMQPTLQSGDFLYINKQKKAAHGDIIVIQVNPGSPYIKRVIGLEGDTIRYDDEYKRLYIKYSNTSEFVSVPIYSSASGHTIDDWTILGNEITILPNQVFFLGDNRLHSYDSTENGCRNLDDILGVVTKWSFKNKKALTFVFNIVTYVGDTFNKITNILFAG